MNSTSTRRHIMQAAIGAIVTAAVPVACFANDLSALFFDQKAAAAIGRAYLSGLSEHGLNLSALQDGLIDMLQDPANPEWQRAALQTRFRHRIQQDFAAGRVVMVDGWVISQVEAQACAVECLRAEGAV